eukprot:jgi/Mesen1/928/ME000118S00109
MGKKQHSKDRLYITTTEWATEWGGAKSKELRTSFKRLPFYCCAYVSRPKPQFDSDSTSTIIATLTFTPFEDPVCTPDGDVFDVLHIVPYIQKYGRSPVTGKPLCVADLFKLNFSKNAEGEFQCPVLGKVFTEFTHIVAVRPTGNVFCYEDPAYFINISGDTKRMLEDLASTDKTREALALGGGGARAKEERAAALASLRLAKERALAEEEARLAREGGAEGGAPAEREKAGGKKGQKRREEERAKEKALEKERAKYKEPAMSIVDAASASLFGRSAEAAKAAGQEKVHARVAAHAAGARAPVEANTKMVRSQYTSGRASRGLTSTTCAPVTEHDYEMVRVERNPKKKGYARVSTSLGALNLELHCDVAPRTCENFLTLCERGYYDNTAFHRNIKSAEAAKAAGQEKVHARVAAHAAGARAPVEANTKMVRSQYTSGRASRGLTSTTCAPVTEHDYEMVRVERNPKKKGYARVSTSLGALNLELHCDVAPRTCENFLTLCERGYYDNTAFHRNINEIKIISTEVFVNPYTEPEEEKEAEKVLTVEEQEENEKVGAWYSNPVQAQGLVAHKVGVGKYMRPLTAPKVGASDANDSIAVVADEAPPPKRRKESTKGGFGDFSGW